jgi:hypothetical protein
MSIDFVVLRARAKLERMGSRMPSLLGDGFLERARSVSLALLGLSTALGLTLVAIALQQGWSVSPNLPIPDVAGDREAVHRAEVVAGPTGPLAFSEDIAPGDGQAPGPVSAGRRSSADGSGLSAARGIATPAEATPPPAADPPAPQAPEPPGAEPAPVPAPAPEPAPVATTAPEPPAGGPVTSAPNAPSDGKSRSKPRRRTKEERDAEKVVAASGKPAAVVTQEKKVRRDEKGSEAASKGGGHEKPPPASKAEDDAASPPPVPAPSKDPVVEEKHESDRDESASHKDEDKH